MRRHSDVLRVLTGLQHRQVLARLEEPFAHDNYRGSPGLDPVSTPPDSAFGGSVILTAPHSVKHFRRGRAKVEETFTGAVTRRLGLVLRVTTVTATIREAHTDVFALRQDTFAKALRPHLTRGAMVFDIHGMRDKWKIDVCLGTGNYPEAFAQRLKEALKSGQPGLVCELNHPFAAKEAYTITRAAQDAQARHAVQVEFSRTYRKKLMTDPALFHLVAQAFHEVTREKM